MHGYIPRFAEKLVDDVLKRAPVVAVLGARQCGKSTLAREYLISSGISHFFLDLQDRADRNKLREPELFFEKHRDVLVCLDEIQAIPDLFPALRVEVDKARKSGRFLILGSASRDLLLQSTETLAGRIAFVDLSPLGIQEVPDKISWQQAWLRGGFPESLLADSDDFSFDWRTDFVRTFMERDIAQFGFAIPVKVIERLWRLLAHYHGQTVNFSKLASSADISVPTLKKYLAILEQTFMIRLLPPAETNLKKRLVKSPKVYLRDSGILHCLLDIENFDSLLGHPVNGPSWEGFVLENIIAFNPRWKPSFIRTSNDAEVDLIMERGQRQVLFECKLSKAPAPSRGFRQIIDDIQPDSAWLVSPVDEAYAIDEGIMVGNTLHATKALR